MLRRPGGLLIDYGETILEELEYNPRAGIELMLRHAVGGPAAVNIDAVVARAERISKEVADRRDVLQIETPWPALTRLIYDFFGIRFVVPLAELELLFWNASVKTRPMPGVREALLEFQRAGVPLGVVSNASFGPEIIRHELGKHGLADFFSEIVVSSEYAVRKPNPLLYETAAARLGVQPVEIWFIGDRLDIDVVGARAAGMTPIWYTPQVPANRADLDVLAQSWPELAETFRSAVVA